MDVPALENSCVESSVRMAAVFPASAEMRVKDDQMDVRLLF
jgi:hypothetical protein